MRGQGSSSWLLIIMFITGSLTNELLFPAPTASKRSNDKYGQKDRLLFLTT